MRWWGNEPATRIGSTVNPNGMAADFIGHDFRISWKMQHIPLYLSATKRMTITLQCSIKSCPTESYTVRRSPRGALQWSATEWLRALLPPGCHGNRPRHTMVTYCTEYVLSHCRSISLGFLNNSLREVSGHVHSHIERVGSAVMQLYNVHTRVWPAWLWYVTHAMYYYYNVW